MVAAKKDLIIEQGADFYKHLIYKDSNKIPKILTSYTAKMQIRATHGSKDVLFELSTANSRIVITANDGKIELMIGNTLTSAMTFTKGVYDLELIDSGGSITRLIEGTITVTKNVTI